MQEWRKQMNAALGVARAQHAAGNTQAAIDAANLAAGLANTSAAATVATNLRQEIYSSSPPLYTPPPSPSPNPETTSPTGGASGGSSFTSYSPAPTSTPASPYWIKERTVQPKTGIKQADPDIILDPQIDTSGDYIVERFFEELGGTELISLSRYDLIDGIDVVYNPIANLSQLRKRFNPNNIIAIDFLSENEFTRTSIDLLSRGMYEPYFNDDGDLVIEIDIIKPEENIETEISLSGTVTRIEL